MLKTKHRFVKCCVSCLNKRAIRRLRLKIMIRR
ncbi:Uncharacterised protein [Vibrio cholerae]|nr:Uncharacterised protein [Vibrio cholerae]